MPLSIVATAIAYGLPEELLDASIAWPQLFSAARQAMHEPAAWRAAWAMNIGEAGAVLLLGVASYFGGRCAPTNRAAGVALIGSLVLTSPFALVGLLLAPLLAVGTVAIARPLDAELLAEGAYSTVGVAMAWIAGLAVLRRRRRPRSTNALSPKKEPA